MNYTTIFKDALRIFWRHKSLWLFGIALTVFGQGEYSFSVNYSESIQTGQDGVNPFSSMPGRELLIRVLENPIPYLVGFFLLNLVIWIIASLICAWLQGGLISMVDQVDQTSTASVDQGLSEGRQRAIPLTLMAILLGAPTVILNIPAILGGVWFFMQFKDLFLAAAMGQMPPPGEIETMMDPVAGVGLILFGCIFPLTCVTAIFGWLLALLNKVASRSLVLENRSIVDSIKRGWQLMRANIGHVLLNGVVLILTSAVFGFIAAFPGLVIWVPVARDVLHQNWTASTSILAVVMTFYLLIVAVALGGTLTSFNSVLWTKLYKAMAQNEITTSPGG